MRINHIQHRQCCHLADGLTQLITYFNATARINHRHTKTPNHKARITNIAIVTIVNIHMHAMMHVNAITHIFNRKIMMSSLRVSWHIRATYQRQNAKQMTKYNH